MSAQVLAAFRERANDDPHLPALMDHMDRAVARCAETDEDFVTAVLVQLGEYGDTTLVNAGHPAPILLSGGAALLVEPEVVRPPLGLGGLTIERKLTLSAWDRLLLYTDGLTEARDPQTRPFYSVSQIVQAVGAVPTVASAVVDLREDVLQWSGGTLDDDIALVLIEHHPHGDELLSSSTAG